MGSPANIPMFFIPTCFLNYAENNVYGSNNSENDKNYTTSYLNREIKYILLDLNLCTMHFTLI